MTRMWLKYDDTDHGDSDDGDYHDKTIVLVTFGFIVTLRVEQSRPLD